MAQSRRGLHQARSQKRGTSWDGGPGDENVINVTGNGIFFLGLGVTPLVAGLTAIRLRGLFSAWLVSATSAGDGFTGAVGVGLTTAASFAIGLTAVPTPLAEITWEGWLYHNFFSVHAGGASGLDAPGAAQHIVVDSKAMRKFNDDMVIYAIIEVDEQGAAGMDVSFNSRMLTKLP